MNLFQHMCPRKQTGCHHVPTQIILLATEFVLVTLWGYCHISPSHLWSLTLRLTACCTLSEVLILQVTRVKLHTVSPEWSTHKTKGTLTFHWKCPRS